MKQTSRCIRFGTAVLSVVTIFALSFSPVITYASTTSEQLSELSKTLTAIGNLIGTSPNLTDAERLTLLKQLVAISTQILQLQGTTAPRTSYVDKVIMSTAVEVGLQNIVMKYDVELNQATVAIEYASTTKNTTYTFQELPSYTDFDTKMTVLRNLAVAKISEEIGVGQRDINKALLISARNPLRDKAIAKNSGVANDLAEKLGQHSIVNKINILPGNGKGRIEIFTDQDETLVLSLEENRGDEFSLSSSDSPTYTYKYEVYIPTLADGSYITSGDSEDSSPVPKVDEIGTNVKVSGIDDYLASLFDNVPFTKAIPDFVGKLRRFLIANPTTLGVGFPSLATDEARSACYSDADKVVVGEFARYLVDGFDAQYVDIAGITKFLAPVNADGELYLGAQCESKTTFFSWTIDVPALAEELGTTYTGGGSSGGSSIKTNSAY